MSENESERERERDLENLFVSTAGLTSHFTPHFIYFTPAVLTLAPKLFQVPQRV